MYSINLIFETSAESSVTNLWRELSVRGIPTDFVGSVGLRPHITLAMFYDIDEKKLVDIFLNCKQNFTPMTLEVESIGIFPSSGTCFLKPTIDLGLLEFHNKIHNSLVCFSDFSYSLYTPGKWNPHISLAINLKNIELLKAVEYLLEIFEPIKIQVTDLGLYKIYMDSDNKTCSYRIDI